jgi:hypothetical protein
MLSDSLKEMIENNMKNNKKSENEKKIENENKNDDLKLVQNTQELIPKMVSKSEKLFIEMSIFFDKNPEKVTIIAKDINSCIQFEIMDNYQNLSQIWILNLSMNDLASIRKLNFKNVRN